jgi:hypothetical protein
MFYPIPIKITNYRGANGEAVNAPTQQTDTSSVQYVRRFFMIDTSSSYQEANQGPQAIRVATSLVLR